MSGILDPIVKTTSKYVRYWINCYRSKPPTARALRPMPLVLSGTADSDSSNSSSQFFLQTVHVLCNLHSFGIHFHPALY